MPDAEGAVAPELGAGGTGAVARGFGGSGLRRGELETTPTGALALVPADTAPLSAAVAVPPPEPSRRSARVSNPNTIITTSAPTNTCHVLRS